MKTMMLVTHLGLDRPGALRTATIGLEQRPAAEDRLEHRHHTPLLLVPVTLVDIIITIIIIIPTNGPVLLARLLEELLLKA
jgi:hypothetical protein